MVGLEGLVNGKQVISEQNFKSKNINYKHGGKYQKKVLRDEPIRDKNQEQEEALSIEMFFVMNLMKPQDI